MARAPGSPCLQYSAPPCTRLSIAAFAAQKHQQQRNEMQTRTREQSIAVQSNSFGGCTPGHSSRAFLGSILQVPNKVFLYQVVNRDLHPRAPAAVVKRSASVAREPAASRAPRRLRPPVCGSCSRPAQGQPAQPWGDSRSTARKERGEWVAHRVLNAIEALGGVAAGVVEDGVPSRVRVNVRRHVIHLPGRPGAAAAAQ